ncbi:MAG: hypothetical protein ACM3Q1_05940 [Bacteroidales bacterium]
MADTEKGRVIGHGPCPNCGHHAAYKLNKKGHVYVYCDVEGNGGCHSGTQSRSNKGDVALTKRITKWTSPEDRKRLLGDDSPAHVPAQKTSWLDRELF